MTSPTERALDLLEDVRQTGLDQWMARCPSHEDKTPSLSIREGDDGRVLLHCFAGCGACHVTAAIGLGMHDLFNKPPEGILHTPAGRRRRAAPPIPAKDALSILNEEALVVCFVALRLEQDEPIEAHRGHLHRAAKRINTVRESWIAAP